MLQSSRNIYKVLPAALPEVIIVPGVSIPWSGFSTDFHFPESKSQESPCWFLECLPLLLPKLL